MIRRAFLPIAALLAGCAAAPTAPGPGGGPSAPGAAGPSAAPATAARPAPVTLRPMAWRCGAMEMTSRYDAAGDRVTLALPGKPPLALPQQGAASGARFADGAGNEFWTKGQEALLTVAGQKYAPCLAFGR